MEKTNKINSGKGDKLTMEDLSAMKVQIRHQIEAQKEKIAQYPVASLLNPSSSSTNFFSSLTNVAAIATNFAISSKKTSREVSIANGVIFGYRMVKNTVQFFKNRKKK